METRTLMNVNDFKAYLVKKNNNEDLTAIGQLIKNLENRIVDIEASIKRASGWAVKESLRHSLRVNHTLLAQAKQVFWEENL